MGNPPDPLNGDPETRTVTGRTSAEGRKEGRDGRGGPTEMQGTDPGSPAKPYAVKEFPGLSVDEPEGVCDEGGAAGGDDLPACTIAKTITM